MLSTPPAIIKSPAPDCIADAQLPTAFKPEPHSRLIVQAGTSWGTPASRLLIRATLRIVFAGLIGAAQHHVVEL